MENVTFPDNKPSKDTTLPKNQSQENPFAYLERVAFTSEKYKIEVRGLPRFYGLNVRILKFVFYCN